MERTRKKLLENSIMLYVLVFSNYFFNFITIPYQTRVLGPEYYGKLGVASAFYVYFQLIFDFGFILSATKETAEHRNDKEALSKILTAVNLSKVFLGIPVFAALWWLRGVSGPVREDFIIYFLYFLCAFLNALLPDYLYRGMENMKFITYRSVGVKLFFTLMIFLYLKEKEQYYLVPALNCAGAGIALLFVYIHVYRKLGLSFKKVSASYVFRTLKNSSLYFISRIAGTVYSASNLVIIGAVYPSGVVSGFYSVSDKLVTTARNGFSPLADSLYPYMLQKKDYSLIKKILIFCVPITAAGCIGIGLFSEQLCAFLFGEEFAQAGEILVRLLPLIVLALPSYIMGFPALSPLGLQKYANYSTIFGAVVQLLQISVVYAAGRLNVYTLCYITTATETAVLCFRIAVIARYRRKCYG